MTTIFLFKLLTEFAINEDVPKGGVRPEPVPIGLEKGRDRKTAGQISPAFATLTFPERVSDTVGQRDTGTKAETVYVSDGLN